MSWLDSRDDYSCVVRVDGELSFDSSIHSFQCSQNKFKDLGKAMAEFVKEMHNPDLVKIEFPKEESTSGPRVYGGPMRYGYFFVEFLVANDDMEKFHNNEPFRLLVKTNVFTGNDDRERFEKFFKGFNESLNWK
jgi:hypothetical protein